MKIKEVYASPVVSFCCSTLTPPPSPPTLSLFIGFTLSLPPLTSSHSTADTCLKYCLCTEPSNLPIISAPCAFHSFDEYPWCKEMQ